MTGPIERCFLNMGNSGHFYRTSVKTKLATQVICLDRGSPAESECVVKLEDVFGNTTYFIGASDSWRTVNADVGEDLIKQNKDCSTERLIWKRRFGAGQIIYFDQFTRIKSREVDLTIKRICFSSGKNSSLFKPILEYDQEITGLPEWSNYSLCKHGQPN